VSRMRPTMLCCALLAASAHAIRTAEPELQVLADAVWVATPGNDGDSFAVRCGDHKLRVRLYFVDTPEVTTEGTGMESRVGVQRRYFGLARDEQVLACGRQASEFTRAALARPFTLYTAFTDARGEGDRVYAFVRTADGADLGEALVAAGLARAYGYSHAAPDGSPAAAVRERLARSEATARAASAGAWQAVPDAPARRARPPAPYARPPSGHPPPAAAPVVLLLVLVVVLAVCAGLWA
jgi:endonuclease YncB( thermonuclease family)